MIQTSHIAIIGAGAAGLAAAIFAGQSAQDRNFNHRIVVLDGAKTIGAKILVSGGGRCNVTHASVRTTDFFGSANPLRNVLSAFNQRQTVAWFESLGVRLKQEPTGKLFPVTDMARTVLDALLGRCADLHIPLSSDHRVIHVDAPSNTEPHFLINHTYGILKCRRLIMATGGRSLPRTGSDGSGWDILRKLGHTVTSTHAALVPLVLDERFFHAGLSGLSHEVELLTFVEGKRIDRRTGSLLWTHFGISGPVVMDASRFFTVACDKGQPVEMLCNVLPGETLESVDAWLIGQSAQRARATLSKVLSERLPTRLVEAIFRQASVEASTTLSHLSKETRRALIRQLVALPLPVIKARGWNYAEVTAGGVPLDEIDYRTMESRKVPGLYLVGELLDVDGRIGGFNFQWAWATGCVAGRAVGGMMDET